MKAEIIRRLKESGGYVSGQELCRQFGVSRTAVWKIISQLKNEGYHIEAVRNKGYRLLEAADVLTEAECRCSLEGCRLGLPVICYEETDSTNIRARALAEDGAAEGTMVTAETQTKGKGRRGRTWESPPGEGLWFSFILRPQIVPAAAPMITLVAALAAAAGIEDVCGLPVRIKWPNDIVLDGRKLVGILTELSAEADQVHYIIVGIGINVNMSEFPEKISRTATSLYLESGKRWKRSDIIAAVMKRMEQYYAVYMRTCDMSLLMEEYTERLVNQGCEVAILRQGEEYRGLCEGIDEMGRLLVTREDGSTEKVLSGEVSVRGIYGYV